MPLNVTAHWNKYDYVEIDIANILFICAGSYSDMMEETSDAKPMRLVGSRTVDGDVTFLTYALA